VSTTVALLGYRHLTVNHTINFVDTSTFTGRERKDKEQQGLRQSELDAASFGASVTHIRLTRSVTPVLEGQCVRDDI